MSRLDLVVGPNGAGKSTFIARVIVPERPGVPVVNADAIAAHRWPDALEQHAYDAARLAEQTRRTLIAQGRPFIAETVFSHPSKLDVIRRASEAGYDVRLHAVMVPVDLAVRRVEARVRTGGHRVPEHKVRERYGRLWPLVAEAIGMAELCRFWTNDRLDGPRLVATFALGVPVGVVAWPSWAHPSLPVSSS